MKKMGYGKVGVSKERMCSYKHTHNSAVHTMSVRDLGHTVKKNKKLKIVKLDLTKHK